MIFHRLAIDSRRDKSGAEHKSTGGQLGSLAAKHLLRRWSADDALHRRPADSSHLFAAKFLKYNENRLTLVAW
jgi:hypothetical protein